MKKTLLWIFLLIGLIFISGCSIKIERDVDVTSQQQLSWLEQRIKDLETENAKLKNKTTTTQPRKSVTPAPVQEEKDNCPNGDQTISTYDWKCDYPRA